MQTKIYEGKRIILVGPARYLQGSGLGEWIDGFDVVVRVNWGLTLKNYKDVGQKTTVLYHTMRKHHENSGRTRLVVDEKDFDFFLKRGVRLVVFRTPTRSNKCALAMSRLEAYKKLPWISFTEEWEDAFRAELGLTKQQPNTGIYAMRHILDHDIKSLHIVGFDFYRSGYCDYYSNIIPFRCRRQTNSGCHNTDKQIEYLRHLKDDRLILDDVLKDIIKHGFHQTARPRIPEPLPEPTFRDHVEGQIIEITDQKTDHMRVLINEIPKTHDIVYHNLRNVDGKQFNLSCWVVSTRAKTFRPSEDLRMQAPNANITCLPDQTYTMVRQSIGFKPPSVALMAMSHLITSGARVKIDREYFIPKLHTYERRYFARLLKRPQVDI